MENILLINFRVNHPPMVSGFPYPLFCKYKRLQTICSQAFIFTLDQVQQRHTVYFLTFYHKAAFYTVMTLLMMDLRCILTVRPGQTSLAGHDLFIKKIIRDCVQ